MIQRFSNWLASPVEGHILGLFRIIYGLFMCYEMIDYMRIDLVKHMFVLPALNFHYTGLYWLEALPEFWMDTIIMVLLGAAVAITLGLWMRIACMIFALGYAYIFLIDVSIYNNHIYLFILLAVLLGFTDADQFFSLRKRRLPDVFVARWQPFIIQAQLVIVYFFAGMIKLRSDWWALQEPVRTVVASISEGFWLGGFYKSEIGIYTMVYVGFLLDVLSPFLLWYKPVRNWAVLPFLAFHYSNSQIFGDIGIFPYIMACSLIIFFEVKELPFLRKLQSAGKAPALPVTRKAVRYTLVAYFAFQVLFPIRGYFLPNDLDYTKIGNRFGWRVKSDTRRPEPMRFVIIDPRSNQGVDVPFQQYVNTMQIMAMLNDPRCVHDFAQWVKAEGVRRGVPNPQVKAIVRFGYNGRPPQDFIDPTVDLASAHWSPFQTIGWVVPVKR